MKTASNNPRKTDTSKDRQRIISQLRKARTANEVIDRLFIKDVESGEIENRTWKYYNHLNKLFSPLHKSGHIELVGVKRGPTNKNEKIWKINRTK